MRGKIDLESHFAIPDTLGCSEVYFDKDVWPGFSKKISDFSTIRLEEMDRYGIERTILSLNSPAVQSIPDAKEAVRVAKKSNDITAEAVRKHPGRYLGFAALPMQDPDAAVSELRRAVRDLGLVGAFVNGFSQIGESYKYLDDPVYYDFWAETEKLDVPFYLHPREPMAANLGPITGHPWLEGSAWAFTVETATHTLRLLCSGIFDDFPKLKLIVGHLGETLPFVIWRTDNRPAKTDRGMPAKRPIMEYMSKNVWFTTSGQFRTNALVDTMMEFGADRILFATDFPFEQTGDACEWFDSCTISENDRYKIGRQNTMDLFRLNP